MMTIHKPCVSIGLTGTPGDGGHKPSLIYTFDWLPKGYGPSLEDRQVCVLFDPDNTLKSKLGRGERHPLIEAIAAAIEKHLTHAQELPGTPHYEQTNDVSSAVTGAVAQTPKADDDASR